MTVSYGRLEESGLDSGNYAASGCSLSGEFSVPHCEQFKPNFVGQYGRA